MRCHTHISRTKSVILAKLIAVISVDAIHTLHVSISICSPLLVAFLLVSLCARWQRTLVWLLLELL